MTIRNLLQGHPQLHDFAKSVSRVLGNRTELYRFLMPALSGMRPFTFLQAGANDGLSHDPFREFILWDQAQGILVEPLPFFFRMLQKNYRCKTTGLLFENCALSYPASTVSFFTLDPKFLKTLPYDATLWGVAGLSRDHILHHLPAGADWAGHIIEVRVPARTIEDIMQAAGLASIDCLFLDVEGHEPNILLNLDYELVKPRLIVYEHLHLGEHRAMIDSHLRTRGFTLHECLQDVVAIR